MDMHQDEILNQWYFNFSEKNPFWFQEQGKGFMLKIYVKINTFLWGQVNLFKVYTFYIIFWSLVKSVNTAHLCLSYWTPNKSLLP